MITIRGGDWRRLVPIAEELLSNPDLSAIKMEKYDGDLGVFSFSYKGFCVEVGRSLRIADKPGLGFRDLLVVKDKRLRRLKRKLKKLWKEVV